MEKVQFDNDNFILYAPDSLSIITEGLEDILNSSFEFYKKLFGVDSFRKIQINFFDDLGKFREFIYDLRGERESLPEYATGTFDQGMINMCLSPNIKNDNPNLNHYKHCASHELFHIMYQELVWEKLGMRRIIWFDEGMAELFSGEYNFTKDSYDKFLNEVRKTTMEVPNLNEISHGASFKNDKYNGYLLSLIAVKEIYDKLGFEKFRKIMYNEDEIIKYGESILKEVF